MKSSARRASPGYAILRSWRAASTVLLLLVAGTGLTGCSVLEKPVRASVYDFGSGPQQVAAAAASLPAVTLAEVDAVGALDSTAVLYRLSFANPHQLLPYAQARWSMAPAQLLRQRLRDTLGQRRSVVGAGDGNLAGTAPALLLRVELEEFSQVFDEPQRSVGLLRLRATLIQSVAGADRLLGQRIFVARRNATTPDAMGGVRALSEASQAVSEEIELWLTQFR